MGIINKVFKGMPSRVLEILEGVVGGSLTTKVQITDTINNVDVMATNGSNGLVVISPNHISTINSTSALLLANATFTGQAEDITNYSILMVTVHSDVASAIDGLCVETSYNGSDWHITDCYTISANTGKIFSVQCASKYFRVKYVNGASNQAHFNLTTKLFTADAKASSHRIADEISDQDDAELIKAVLTAQKPNLQFTNIQSSASGNMKVTDAENHLAIAKGQVIGSSYMNKWGNAPDFDTTDLEVDIWDGAEDGTNWELMKYIFPTTASIDSVSSDSIADTNTMAIEGLDLAGNIVTQTITLNGRTRVALTTPLWRVYRAYNNNGVEFVGHIIIYENTPLTLGVPTDKTKIKAVIHPEEQQTEMAIYTIPAGKIGYLTGGYCSIAGANKSSNYVLKFKSRNINGVFRTQQKVALSDTGTSFLQFEYSVPLKLEALTDIKVTASAEAVGVTGASISAGFSIILVDN